MVKLQRFLESQGLSNPWPELLPIITDEVDCNIFFLPVQRRSIQNPNIPTFGELDELYSQDFDKLKVSFYPKHSSLTKDQIEVLKKRIQIINSHLELEGWEVLEPFKENTRAIIYQLPLNFKTCQSCIFRVIKDDGYSNYTVESSESHCLKNQWVKPVSRCEAEDCSFYTKNEGEALNILVEDNIVDVIKDLENGTSKTGNDYQKLYHNEELIKALTNYTNW